MGITSKSVCDKEPAAIYVPVEGDKSGYCLCPMYSGVFDDKTMKCSDATKINGIEYSKYSSNAPFIQHHFKYANACMDNYTAYKLPAFTNYTRCTSTQCPDGWTFKEKDKNCERTIDSKLYKLFQPTVGYIAVPSDVKYNISKTKDLALEEVPEDRTGKIIKIVSISVGIIVVLGLLLFLAYILFTPTDQTESTPPPSLTPSQQQIGGRRRK